MIKEKASNDDYKRSDFSTHKNKYNNYMEAYYDNLIYNYGYNSNDSCGYIALSMLLSYYDNYISDDIIDEKYDVSTNNTTNDFIKYRISPGTLCETGHEHKNYHTYYDYILATKNYNFHTYLISLGIEAGVNKKSDDGYPTSMNDRIKVLKKYLDSKNIDYSIDSKQFKTSKKIKEYVIENIKKGYPVLVGVKNNYNAHAVIAYEYDETNDKIYCHMGDALHTRNTIEDVEFTKYVNAMVLKINQPHTHTNNYVVNGQTYCYCNTHLKVYDDIKHNYKYTCIDSSNHHAYCSCGENFIDKHEFKRTFNSGKAKSVCIDCGFTIDSDDYNIISEGRH